MSSEDTNEAVRASCEAAARGDASMVMACLQCRPVAAPTGLDANLLPMTAASRRLLELLDDDPPDHAFRALMTVPCCYETPWRAALHMVKAFHSQTGSLGKQSSRVLRTCVTDVQSFLQQTATSWWKQERQRTSSTSQCSQTRSFPTTDVTPRLMLEQLVDSTLRPLVDEFCSPLATDNQHWTQPLQLVTTVVSFCHDLDICQKGTISNYVLDRLFHEKHSVRPDRILPWFTLGSDLRSHLRDSDWKRLYEILLEALTSHSDSIPPSDMPGLIRGIVSFLSEDENDRGLLILHLLHAASKDASMYSTVETVLKSSLASLPTPILQRCIQISDNEGVPRWAVANMNLLLLQAIQMSGSEMVSNLVSQALGRGGGDIGSGLIQQCWESLVQLAFPSTLDAYQKRRRKRKSQAMITATKKVMDNVYYQGNGRFARDSEGNNIRNLSTELVCQSIFLGKTTLSQRTHHVYASERAQLWVHAADTVLRPGVGTSDSGAQTFVDIMFAILIMVTVYCEVPASRSTVVRTTMQCLAGNENYATSGDKQVYHCVMIATIVRSITQQPDLSLDNGMMELNPLSGIFGVVLEKDVFQDLATALSPLSASRAALLSISRKYLHSSFGINFWWGMGTSSRGMKESRERIDCALHGLCTLLATEDQPWDECGKESWATLFDVIVQNKPALPKSERSCLFRRLMQLTKQQKFSPTTIEHLLRATLVRLLQYFEAGYEEPLQFVPERVFVTWGARDASKKGHAQTSQTEDMAGLMRLVMVLLEHQHAIHDPLLPEMDASSVLFYGRNHILRILSGSHQHDRLEELSPLENCQWMLESSESLCSSVACACIIAVLRSAISNSALTQPAQHRQRRSDDCSITERWRKKLLSTEMKECTSKHISSNPEKHLSWTKSPSFDIHSAANHHLSACDSTMMYALLSSLCDIVMDYIFHCHWSRDGSNSIGSELNDHNKRCVLECAVFLIDVKRGLSSREGGGIHVSDERLAAITFDSETIWTTASPFLEMCSDVVKASLSGSVNLGMTKRLLQSILEYCTALRRVACLEEGSAIGETERYHITRTLWHLFLAIGEDESAQRLVTFLEEHGFCQSDTHSFLTIRTEGDIDAIVRRIRLTVLSTMVAWLQSLPRSNPNWSDDLWNDSSKVRPLRGLSITFWLECIQTFSSDLRAGLDGHSGGMTEDLYSTYLSLIENSCSLVLLETHQGTEKGLERQISSVARGCASILMEILCVFPLKCAAQFKKTMMLSTLVLPSMGRQAVIMLVASGSEGCMGTGRDLAVDVFNQMINVRLRQHRLGIDIAGTAHNGAADGGSKHESVTPSGGQPLNSAQIAGDGIPSVVVIPTGEPCKSGIHNAAPQQWENKVILPSKESWSWACCCSLAAMEGLWRESYSIVQGTVDYVIEPTSHTVLSWAKYCSEHAKTLSDVLTVTCSAMKTFDELKCTEDVPFASSAEETKNNSMTVLAMQFPDVVKVRLCILLERVSTVLQLTIRSISNQLKRDDRVGSLVRAETVSCICAWLNADTEELDIVSLSRRWYLAEKQMWHAGGSGGVYKSPSPALRRLPKICIRMQELETDLRKLLQIIIKAEKGGSMGPLGVINQYEALLYPQTDKNSPRVPLQSMIKGKLKSSAKSLAVSDSFGLTAMNVNESDILLGSIRKRSRRAFDVECKMKNVRRRNVPRSRNQLVDKWRILDEGVEEGVDDDAYVDLEDFLVDG